MRYTKRSASPLAHRHSVDDDVARARARQVQAGRVVEGWQKWYRRLNQAAYNNSYIKEVAASHLGPNCEPITLCSGVAPCPAAPSRPTHRLPCSLSIPHPPFG